MGEIKQANFRIDSDTADAFRQFCESEGLNQAQGFDHIMQVVELDRAKTSNPERSTDIETFEMHSKALTEAYLNSIELMSQTEARVREQFQGELTRKDRTISDLQEKQDQLTAKVEAANTALQEAEKETSAAQKEAEQAKKDAASAQSLADEKGRTNDMLTAKLTEAEGKLAGYDDLKSSEQSLKAKVSDLEHSLAMEQAEGKHKEEKITDLQSSLDTASKTIADQESLLATMKDELAKSKQEVIDAKNKADNDLASAQKDAEILQMKALESLHNELNETIQTLREEKAALQARIDMLQSSAKAE